MNTTRWFPNTTTPFHWGIYETRNCDRVIERTKFNIGKWETETPFDKWRGIDCSLRKSEIIKLGSVIEFSEQYKNRREKRESTAALRLARHYFSVLIQNTATGKPKTFKMTTCRFYRIASECIALNPVDMRAFEMTLDDLSEKARSCHLNGTQSITHVPDEL